MKKLLVMMVMAIVFANIAYANTAWEMFGGDAEHSGWGISFAPNYSLYDSSGLVSSTALSAGSIQSSPIIKNKVAFINSPSRTAGILLKDLTSGVVTNFAHNDTGESLSSPMIARNKYCYVDTKNLYCRYLANNSVAWYYNAPADILFGSSSPAFANGKIWIGSRLDPEGDIRVTSPALFGFDENNSVPLHQITPPAYVFPDGVNEYAEKVYTPAVSGGKVYVGLDYRVSGKSSRILAVYENNGSIAWNRFLDVGEGVLTQNTPSIHNEKLFIVVIDDAGVDQNDKILALNKNDGSLLWQAEITNATQSVVNLLPVVYAGKVFIASADRNIAGVSYVYAYNETDGSLVWKSGSVPGIIWASPSVADSLLIISVGAGPSNPGTGIYGLSTLNGRQVWQYNSEGIELESVPAIVNGTVYLGDSSGNLIEMKAKTDRATTISINPNDKTTASFPEANVYVEVKAKPGFTRTGSVSITKKIDESSSLSGLQKLNKFASITGNLAVLSSLQYLYIRIYYTDDEIKSLGLTEEQLQMYSRSGTRWNLLINTGVDTVNNFVWANLSSSEIGLTGVEVGVADIGKDNANSQALNEDANTTLEIGNGGNLKDSDADGIIDLVDNCRLFSNLGQEDADGDGIGDACDNCVDIKNGAQIDTDDDGLGNECDEDDDDDGSPDSQDNCPLVAFAPALDYDGDGADDGCDRCPLLNVVNNSGIPNLNCEIEGRPSVCGSINLGLIDATIDSVSNNVVGTPANIDLNLVEGWNLVSLPIKPADTNIQNVLTSINGKYSIVWKFIVNENGFEWKSYNPSKPAFLQSLDRLEYNGGFWIKMNEDAVLSLSGVQPASMQMNLREGFNLIGYPGLQAGNPADMFADVLGDINIVYGYDAVLDEFEVYVPIFSNNTLISIEPGRAYWVNVGRDVTLVFENNVYSTTSNYPLFIESPVRETLISLMRNSTGIIPRWNAGSCDSAGGQTCALARTSLQAFGEILQTQRGLDVSEKAADWYASCLNNL